jgi:hypothetical protein
MPVMWVNKPGSSDYTQVMWVNKPGLWVNMPGW